MGSKESRNGYMQVLRLRGGDAACVTAAQGLSRERESVSRSMFAHQRIEKWSIAYSIGWPAEILSTMWPGLCPYSVVRRAKTLVF
jgi:hypothetical protein